VRDCGQDILKLSDEARRRVRGPEISMVLVLFAAPAGIGVAIAWVMGIRIN